MSVNASLMRISLIIAICVGASGLNNETSLLSPQFSYLLVHTLNGDVHLVQRQTGSLKWSIHLAPVLRVSYNRGPVLIVDPLEGRLYEYSTSASNDLFSYLDHSVMGYVRRSPAYYKDHLSFGSKTDFWISIDVPTGKVFHTSSQHEECPNQLPSGEFTSFAAPSILEDSLGLGQTQYNLVFRDPLTRVTKLNITYNTFATHTEPDLQNIDLQHVVTTEPRLLTFKGRKLVWEIALSSPVVGLYAVSDLNAEKMLRNCQLSSPSQMDPDSWSEAPSTGSPDLTDSEPPLITNSCVEANLRPSPRVLKRVAFTTYALDFGKQIPVTQKDRKIYFESKFNHTLDLVLCLMVDRTSTAALYAIPCVAEATLQLRSIRRASEGLLLEGPESQLALLPEPDSDLDGWSRGLIGLYELPWSQLNRWAVKNHVPHWAHISRWKQITDRTNRGVLIVSPGTSSWSDPYAPSPQMTGIHFILRALREKPIVVISIFLITSSTAWVVAGVLFSKLRSGGHKIQRSTQPVMPNTPSAAVEHNSPFLPVHFDMPDCDGWAGCSAEEAGQPEAIRFNLNDVIGHGANGTMVFAGTFGEHQTAVKRIVRQHQLEKHWRREHSILLHLQHPNLVRCFWTGSTANFHYLVMQRCTMSLTDLLRSGSPNPFAHYQLSSVQVINQYLLAVACLHRNRIVHRDLKPSNILIVSIGAEARIVVGDFGLSRPLPTGRHELTNSFQPQLLVNLRVKRSFAEVDRATRGSTVAYDNTALFEIPSGDQTSLGMTHGTLGWMAPELYDTGADRLTYAIDVFSCGLLAYHVMTLGGHPYDSLHSEAVDQTNDNPLNSGSQKSTGSTQSENSFSATLSRHHARQLAIVEGRLPVFDGLFRDVENLSTAILGCHLIKSMLSSEPQKRPSVEEALCHPFFWSPAKVIRFVSDLSDLLDTREDESATIKPSAQFEENQTDAIKSSFVAQRRALLGDVEKYGHLVFNKHWFCRLEPELVQDLLSTRGYQDTSLMDLLRAIRNKRNHFWHLKEHIRHLFGNTHTGMANYWMARFPCLLPLLYDLSRRHLLCVSSMTEFLPTTSGLKQTDEPEIPICSVPWAIDKDTRLADFHYQRLSREPASLPWRRGEVLSASPVKRPDVSRSPSAESGVEANDKNCLAGVEDFIPAKSRRRRPHQAKRMRPPKRKFDRLGHLSTAGAS